MANRDFFDEDLIKPRSEGGEIRLGPSAPADSGPEREFDAVGRSGELEMPLIVRHKKKLEEEAARHAQEIERLRQLQENLEREKRELEELRRKQNDYERGKHEMLERIQQSLVALERHELRTAQLSELLQNARQRFREIEAQIRGIREDEWREETIRDELTRALALLEDARVEFNRTMARIEALLNDQAKGPAPAIVFEEQGSTPSLEERGFWQWVGIGFAVTLPLILTLVVLIAVLAIRGTLYP